MAQTERLYFCCTAKTGALIIGILSAGSCIHGILGIVSLVYTMSSDITYHHRYKVDYLLIYSVLFGTAVYLALNLAASMALIYGVQRRKPSYVFPFVCLSLSGIVASIGVFFTVTSYSLLAFPINVALMMLLISVACLWIEFYCFAIVKGFYDQLLREYLPKLVYTYPPIDIPSSVDIIEKKIPN